VTKRHSTAALRIGALPLTEAQLIGHIGWQLAESRKHNKEMNQLNYDVFLFIKTREKNTMHLPDFKND